MNNTDFNQSLDDFRTMREIELEDKGAAGYCEKCDGDMRSLPSIWLPDNCNEGVTTTVIGA